MHRLISTKHKVIVLQEELEQLLDKEVTSCDSLEQKIRDLGEQVASMNRKMESEGKKDSESTPLPCLSDYGRRLNGFGDSCEATSIKLAYKSH